MFASNSTAALGPQAWDYTFDQAKTAVLSIADRFGIHVAKEVLTSLGEDKLSSDAPNWMFAEVVRFSKLEASTADEFCAALTAESVEFLEKLRPERTVGIDRDRAGREANDDHCQAARARRETSFGLTTGDVTFTFP